MRRLPRPRSTRFGVRMAAACSAAALACSSPLGPGEVAGTFALQRVAGDPLPAVDFENADVTSRVFADTIRLDGRGGGMAVGMRETVMRATGVRYGPTPAASELRYRIVDGRIAIEYVCPPNALCAAGPHLVARRTADGLRVDEALAGRVPRLYGRVAR